MRELKLVPGGGKKSWKRLERGLFVYLPTGMIYVRKTFERERLPELFSPTGFTVKEKNKARTKAMEMISEWRNPRKHQAEVRFAELFQEILRVVTPDRRLTTQYLHNIYFAELAEEWGNVRVNDFSVAAWVTWLESFRTKKRRATFGDYSKHMNLALKYAHEHRYATYRIRVPNPDKGRKVDFRVFTPEELDRLYNAMCEETRDQYVLSYECGMRLREMLYLTWERVNLLTGKVSLRAEDVKTGSKTGKGREFYISADALGRLRDRWDRLGRPTVGPVFKSDYTGRSVHQNKTAWRNAKRRAGITGQAKWHSLRHTAITHMLFPPGGGRGADPIWVSEYCGVSMRTLQRVYLHSTADDTRAVSNVLSLRKFREKPVNEGGK